MILSNYFKRIFDYFFAFLILSVFSPCIILVSFIIFIQDFKTPFYISSRVGKNGKIFRMVKFRTMVIQADKSGVDSTSADDPRITPVGTIVRRSKFDEILQFINVLGGQMSVVGPRPNVLNETKNYTEVEKELLRVNPGITDLASIVFSDESEILKGAINPDLMYNQLIRPWKSKLGLWYIHNRSLLLDLKIILFTLYSFINRNRCLIKISNEISKIDPNNELVQVVRRSHRLSPSPPPGATEVVTDRKLN
jgi:lipopolysaccharide/colanic/teichoic acid biosynthesis glycosyltransferase